MSASSAEVKEIGTDTEVSQQIPRCRAQSVSDLPLQFKVRVSLETSLYLCPSNCFLWWQ